MIRWGHTVVAHSEISLVGGILRLNEGHLDGSEGVNEKSHYYWQ